MVQECVRCCDIHFPFPKPKNAPFFGFPAPEVSFRRPFGLPMRFAMAFPWAGAGFPAPGNQPAMRAFLAINLPDEVTAALSALAARLPVGKPVSRENMHLTLAFLGDERTEALEELDGELQMLRAAPFEISLKGLGTFGGRSPRVVFAALAPCPALDALHARIARAVRASGITTDKQAFHPHVTFARLPAHTDPAGLQQLRHFLGAQALFETPPFTVTGFSLYRSTLAPKGARHDELAGYPLNGFQPPLET